MKHKGNLIVKKGKDYSNVTEISGCLDCDFADTNISFPKLTSIGHFLNCSGVDTKTSFPKLTSIGGHLYCEGAEADFNKHLNTEDAEAKQRCKNMTFASFLRSGFIFADELLARLISSRKSGRTTVYKVVIVGKSEQSIVIETNGTFSHGKTIKEAKESLIFKITDRDTERFKSWKLNTKISAADAIAAYRAITGACEFGTKHFCEEKDLTKTYTPKEIITMTAGAYGNDTFRNFFTK